MIVESRSDVGAESLHSAEASRVDCASEPNNCCHVSLHQRYKMTVRSYNQLKNIHTRWILGLMTNKYPATMDHLTRRKTLLDVG
jgi:hypothetical protein